MKISTRDVPKIWFTSDTHFRHKNILTFCPNTRKGTNVDEHDRFLIETWQEDVGQEDLVFMLGDVSFGDAAETHNILRQLPGQKILIWGNHDKVIRSDHSLQAHFYKMADYARISIDNQPVILFHYPIWEFDMMHRGAYHFHGHVHGSTTTHPPVIPGRVWDVSLDTRPDADMKLWSWEELDRMMKKLPIRTHHKQ